MAATESRSLELRSVAVGAWVLAFVATVLRVYSRAVIMKAFAIDDWLMMVAMFAFTINTITCVLGTIHGSGMHMADLTPQSIETALMWWYACYPTIALTIVTSKLSVGYYLLRITTQRLHRWIVYIANGACVVASATFFFVTVLQCQPISYAWNKISETGTCIPIDTIIDIMYAYSAFTLFTDIAFTVLPAWLVFNLQMNLKTKLALTLILGMACVASSAVIVRFPHIQDFKDPDFLWAATTVSIWSQIEAGLAIAAGSCATLRPLFKIMLHKLGLTTDTHTTPTNPSNAYGRSHSNNKTGRSGGGDHRSYIGKSGSGAAGGRDVYNMSTWRGGGRQGTRGGQQCRQHGGPAQQGWRTRRSCCSLGTQGMTSP
ncbi:hypothetical protein Micbo1qcDRAFT_213432 [Microdochium bolleyi]|uniref:Rhodopsin domain-containing protein n=1 Tax=Microdochium bolleyi TaxID=196109 RepID=A0A136IWE5_9PEZI|nr:hypothetical protein Micbo1qcDRAFT_213432 [Microdochium bolleyi]